MTFENGKWRPRTLRNWPNVDRFEFLKITVLILCFHNKRRCAEKWNWTNGRDGQSMSKFITSPSMSMQVLFAHFAHVHQLCKIFVKGSNNLVNNLSTHRLNNKPHILPRISAIVICNLPHCSGLCERNTTKIGSQHIPFSTVSDMAPCNFKPVDRWLPID